MPDNTATRLAAYYAAELRILDAQRLGHGDRQRHNAELATVQAGIRELEARAARATGGGFKAVDFRTQCG